MRRRASGGAVRRGCCAPSHLVIYLSARCNLRCSYCYVVKNDATAIKAPRLFRAIEQFAALGGERWKVTFLGGEPLLHPGLLKASILWTRRLLPPGTPVKVFTNGTLLTPPLLRFFKMQGVRLVLSLDGGRAANDAARKFPGSGASVFRTALARLGKGRKNISVSMVVTPDSAHALGENIAALRAAGFERIGWAPDVTADWRGGVGVLERAARAVKLAYFKDLRAGAPVYEIANIYEFLPGESGAGPDVCSSLVLFPDGCFYPCDKLFGAPPGTLRAFRLAGPGAGQTAGSVFARAAAAAGRSSRRRNCPAGSWAHFKYVSGAAPSELKNILAAHTALRKVTDGFYRGLAAAGPRFPAFRRMHGLPGLAAAGSRGRRAL